MNPYRPLQQLISEILDQSGFRQNPYFVSLLDGSFQKEDFVETQIQFYFAVAFFNRPMAALAAKIPTPELRLEVLRNVWEEHGDGDIDRIHGNTFTELLRRIAEVSTDDIESRALWPEVKAFNTVLTGACVLDDYLAGVGIMGMIERMFAEISAMIGQGIVQRNWLPEEKLIHYTLHKELDMKHSQDFFEILEKAWGKSPENRYNIEQGLRLGEYIFNRLYEDLFRSRERRKANGAGSNNER